MAPIPADQDARDWIFYDMGQATMNMMLAATELGIGSSHAAIDDQALARRILNLPEDRFCVGLVAFGYPVGSPTHADRPARTAVPWTTSSTANAGEACVIPTRVSVTVPRSDGVDPPQ